MSKEKRGKKCFKFKEVFDRFQCIQKKNKNIDIIHVRVPSKVIHHREGLCGLSRFVAKHLKRCFRNPVFFIMVFAKNLVFDALFKQETKELSCILLTYRANNFTTVFVKVTSKECKK
ncbi:hypothetical protein PHYBLDRAFT_71959 [Phycomyces blakesleeanus NRRL 1555(-)]|uniref:Uncharacterized protein n=1 Tax=Phycomyces blakesleeanus (strain ATCC 8743b / DSM 1359 / FGSC 10004 / NBRC 33097 / NRRL 1555) TaxID=763407 RepID=A0A162NLB7_PHYB8|nr:hypothetical protein PHYBLDRAFT_71959 [Phycomyces blakesleeanus NRRL 1555(-)]OAD75278.1 hypothetical protein PHYBLDRAFT_71959 [Phycomyces blakesleeanus NRRL 1555(-)]|eukprot:XP_018293318.1 hypothetical protein PHYBLDRAFT_71959 [Phycomyces blakesleeanus NRRL 1555(-)]